MSSPDPSLDNSDLYKPWDPYDNPSQQQTQTNDLKLCQFHDWDSKRIYDDSYIHYSIEWKITLNNRAIVRPYYLRALRQGNGRCGSVSTTVRLLHDMTT